MRIHTCNNPLTQFKMILSASLLAAAMAACFAGNAHADAIDVGATSPSTQPTQGGPGWTSDTSTGPSIEQAHRAPAATTQGGPDWQPDSRARVRQGGPGWDAPDALVDDPSQSSAPAAAGTDDSAPDQEEAMAVNIEFPPYSAALSDDAAAALQDISANVGDLPVNIVITGRTDPVEQQSATALSMARAQSVAEYLVANGIDPQRIALQAVGDTEPLVDGSNCETLSDADLAACLAPDRSATILVVGFDTGRAVID